MMAVRHPLLSIRTTPKKEVTTDRKVKLLGLSSRSQQDVMVPVTLLPTYSNTKPRRGRGLWLFEDVS